MLHSHNRFEIYQHMHARLSQAPIRGQVLHVSPRPPEQGHLTARKRRGRISPVLAIKPLHILRGARNLSPSQISRPITYTRPQTSPRGIGSQRRIQRSFTTTPTTMTATKIDGTAIAKAIRERLHAEIEKTQKTNPRYKPSLKIIQGSPMPTRFSGLHTNLSVN